jgi:RND family efflux transporter MFP subunit
MKYYYFRMTGLFIIVSAGLLIQSCSSSKAADEPRREKFQVIQPALMDTVYNNEYVAEIQSVQNVEVRARVKGFIEKIYVDEGKPVKEGQVLFTLSGRAFREDLAKANALLKSATAELKSVEVEIKNTKLLVDKNIISKSELEMLQARRDAALAKIDEANSSISLANLHLSYTQVRAPFSGTINRIPNKAGSLVEEGTLLTTISNNKEVFAYFNVSEREYLDFVKQKQLGKSQEVSLLLADGSLFPYKGNIETVESEIDQSSGNLAFRARFPNPEEILKHGSNGKIVLEKELKDVLVVPQKSTFEIQDKVFVFVVNDKNVVEQKNIIPKMRLHHYYVLESGLTKNDRILYEGVQHVKDGDVIVPELLNEQVPLALNK